MKTCPRCGTKFVGLCPVCYDIEPKPAPGNFQRYIEERLQDEPVGDWFVDAVLDAVVAGNQPAEDGRWNPS
jgi:hypothetical protein